MKRWEIWLYPIPSADNPHPFIILSSNAQIAGRKSVNAIGCTSWKQGHVLKPYEILLNEADGMDWKTVADCSFIYDLNKKHFIEQRGTLTQPKQGRIAKLFYDFLMGS